MPTWSSAIYCTSRARSSHYTWAVERWKAKHHHYYTGGKKKKTSAHTAVVGQREGLRLPPTSPSPRTNSVVCRSRKTLCEPDTEKKNKHEPQYLYSYVPTRKQASLADSFFTWISARMRWAAKPGDEKMRFPPELSPPSRDSTYTWHHPSSPSHKKKKEKKKSETRLTSR